MTKRILLSILLIFIISDIGYSFVQHLQMPLDGDMAESILPANGYEKIFQDPFGISVITQNAIYPNPNRFFAQWTFATYFQTFPFILQNFVNPIKSVYLSCAIAKISIQIGILVLLGFFITGARAIFKKEFLIAIALIIPLFQTNGYRSYMGIIDPSITYTFFYALPGALLLLFYLPFFDASFHQKKFTTNKIGLVLLSLFAIFITFNGPLIPGAVLVTSLLYIVHHFKLNYFATKETSFVLRTFTTLKKIPKEHFFFFSFISVLSLYSLYIGSNNSQFIHDKIAIYQRYLRLPEGLYYLLTQKIGYPLLLCMIGINAFLINKNYKTPEGNKILNLLKWIGIFSILYIILLPLGGYRSYRPDIIRYDSIMPITIALIFIYGLSAYFLIQNLKNKKRTIYLFVIISFSFIFTLADEPELGKNKGEMTALQKLADSKENSVMMDDDCTIMAWKKIEEPNASESNARLIQYWGITKEKKLYYQK